MPYNEAGEWQDEEDEGFTWGEILGEEGPGAGYGEDGGYGSPYEKAEAEGYLDEFNAQNEDIYASPEATQAAVDEGVNLYNEPDGGGGGGSRQYTAEEEEFLRNNPGDYDRMAAALANDTDPTDEPGEPGWTGDGGGPRAERGAASTYESRLASMGAKYGGPGSPGVYKGPVQQGGQDPFSKLITGGYADLIAGRGQTPFGTEMEDYLRRLMARGGEIEEDPRLLAQQMEAARQPIESFRKMQTNQYQGQLADRGLLSEPGMPQGTEISAAGRLEEELAPWYARAGQNLASQRAQEKGQRFDRALTLGTGLAGQQSRDFLNALRGGHERQTGLSEIALGTLDRNMAWSRFLAEFGMDRDQALETLQSGRVDDVEKMLELFQDYVDASRGGYR